MKKFVVITAIILGVFAFVSMEANATAPTVGDIPDVQLYTGPSTDGIGIFNLNDFVGDYDDDSHTWTGTPSGFTADPVVSTGSAPDFTADIGGGGTPGDDGSILWEATDGDTQVDSDSSELWRTDFWLTMPSLTDDNLVTTGVDVQIVNVLRDSALTSDGSLWTGIQPSLSNPETLSWTVSIRGLTDPTTYPKVGAVGSVSGYGLTASIDGASGIFTLTPQAGGLSDALEVGFLATDGTSKSGARVIAVQDVLPSDGGASSDFAAEHGFETAYTEIPNGLATGGSGDLFNAVSDFGWSLQAGTLVLGFPAGDTAIVDLASGDFTGPTPPSATIADSKVLKVSVDVTEGLQISSNRIPYESGATYCFEFYLSTGCTTAAALPRLRMGLTNFGGASAFTEINESDYPEFAGGGSMLPLQADGWKKFQVYADMQVPQSSAPDGVFAVIQILKTVGTGSADVYIDNVGIYKVKTPLDLAYGSTAVPVGDTVYAAIDDLDGTFERTTSKASNTDPLAIVGILNVTSSLGAATDAGASDTIEVAADGGSITNHTFASGASRSLAFTTGGTLNPSGANQVVLRAISLNAWDLADSGNAGPGVYQMSSWVSTSASDRGTGAEVPYLQWGVLEDGGAAVDGNVGLVFTKQRFGVASPIAGDGWQNYLLTVPTYRDLQKLLCVIDVIKAPTAGSSDTVYFDDIELRKVKDKDQYFDASLF